MPAIATGLYVGKYPKAPGTIGSLTTFVWIILLSVVLRTPLIEMLQDAPLMYTVVGIIYALGAIATRHYMKLTGKHDPKEVVIDEVAGQWLTVALTAPILGWFQVQITTGLVVFYFVLCFGFFRLFDIVKIGPVKWADTKVDGSHGVMLDDMFAGVLAAISVYIVLLVFFNF